MPVESVDVQESWSKTVFGIPRRTAVAGEVHLTVGAVVLAEMATARLTVQVVLILVRLEASDVSVLLSRYVRPTLPRAVVSGARSPSVHPGRCASMIAASSCRPIAPTHVLWERSDAGRASRWKSARL